MKKKFKKNTNLQISYYKNMKICPICNNKLKYDMEPYNNANGRIDCNVKCISKKCNFFTEISLELKQILVRSKDDDWYELFNDDIKAILHNREEILNRL